MLNKIFARAGFFRRSFTMIELIVVLVIISLLTAVAVSALREESPASQLNRQTLALNAWCATVRYVSAEEGRDYSVRFVPEKKFFYACPVEESTDEGYAEVPASGPMRLNFPENMEISTVEQEEDQARETEFVELFRFYPGGGAVCINRPVLKRDELVKVFKITFLTGQLQSTNGEEDNLQQVTE